MSDPLPESRTTPDQGQPGHLLLQAEDVNVTYRVHIDRPRQLRDHFLRRQSQWVDVHAVRGVTFELREGEVLGVIGPNGSGKSTLLRAIAGLLPVTGGRVLASSRPVLLGVGAILNPELSGRRNIYLGSLALGKSASEAAAGVDEIIEFSGLAESIDLPLRTYSTGMRSRLHFAIATAVAPEMLLLDETTAGGDAEFRARSRERLQRLRDQAGAVIIVSHSRDEVVDVCTRAIWLDQGRIRRQGDPEYVFDEYSAFVADRRRGSSRTDG